MLLVLESLKKAILALDRSIEVFHKTEKLFIEDTALHETLRSGVIQNFEVAYELCWKFMKRWLEEAVGNKEADGYTRRELFRVSAEHQLIEDVNAWMDYHHARNETSHIYQEETANEVFQKCLQFSPVAHALYQVLEAHND